MIYNVNYKNWIQGSCLNIKRRYHGSIDNQKAEAIHFMGELEENDNLLKSMKI